MLASEWFEEPKLRNASELAEHFTCICPIFTLIHTVTQNINWIWHAAFEFHNTKTKTKKTTNCYL